MIFPSFMHTMTSGYDFVTRLNYASQILVIRQPSSPDILIYASSLKKLDYAYLLN